MDPSREMFDHVKAVGGIEGGEKRKEGSFDGEEEKGRGFLHKNCCSPPPTAAVPRSRLAQSTTRGEPPAQPTTHPE